MTNPAIRSQPNGDVDIAVPDEATEASAEAGTGVGSEAAPSPEPSVDPENLDHPEELMGE